MSVGRPAAYGRPVSAWVPQACTLPTAEQPLRVAEFDRLFSSAVAVDRPAPDRLTVVLTGGRDVANVARDLVARETRCCSFFAFSVVERGDATELEVRVPPEQVAVLDAVAARVEAKLACS